jgi:hypothetical protein
LFLKLESTHCAPFIQIPQFKKSHSLMILYSTIIIFIKVFAIPALNPFMSSAV